MTSGAAGIVVLKGSRGRAVRWRGVLAALSLVVVVSGSSAAFASGAGAPPSAVRAPARTARGWSAMPVGARAAVSRGLGADQRTFFASRTAPGVVSLDNAGQGLRATLSGGRLGLSGAHGLRVGLSSLAIGRGRSVTLVAALAAASIRQNNVAFSSSSVSEWFANGPYGVEQGFTLARRPAGRGPLLITQTLSGNATARVAADGQSATLSSRSGVLRYAGLYVTDAAGHRVPARLSVDAHRLTIAVNDAQAVYPLRVDPEFQQATELTASDATATENLGASVALSGSTIVVGAPGDNGRQGAVYVYTIPSAGDWANATQTAELSASDGAPGNNLGNSVAMSGSTIIAGAPGHARGAVYEWTMPVGGWASATTQNAELTASGATNGSSVGSSVAISGSTIVAGAPGTAANQGAVYEYTMPTGGWVSATQTAELTAAHAQMSLVYLGVSVSVSGSTIVAGALGLNLYAGGVYEWTMPAGGWVNATQTAALTASDAAPISDLGSTVATSGSTIVAGAYGANGNLGEVYVYTMPTSGGWVNATQTAELSASDATMYDRFGFSVGISGPTIVAGAWSNTSPGVEYVFAMPASGGWVNATQTTELTASDGAAADGFGFSTSISGSTIVVGARYTNGEGAAYVFGPPPVTSATVSLALSPASIEANGTSTSTATFTDDDTSGNPESGNAVTIASSGGQAVGPVTAGATPGTYTATITSTTTAGTATVTATDTWASPNAAATATLTQTEPPSAPPTAVPQPATAPPMTAPPNAFTIIGGATRGPDGAIVVDVKIPGPGAVELLGTHEDVIGGIARVLEPGPHRFDWGRASASATRAGAIAITLQPDRNGRRLLARHRRYAMALNVAVWVTFTPTGGSARRQTLNVRVLSANNGSTDARSPR